MFVGVDGPELSTHLVPPIDLQALRIPDLEPIEMPHAFGWGQPPSESEAEMRRRSMKIPMW